MKFKKYRIIKVPSKLGDHFFYTAQERYFFFPIWVDCDFVNIHHTKRAASEFIKREKNKPKDLVVWEEK